MIRITRPTKAPAVLGARGAVAVKAHARAVAKGKSPKFDNTIYGDESVKQALVQAQHKKCCFCESRVTHIAFGHIEHFRPKGGVRQSKTAAMKKPGYWWLAYEWTNLLFSCELCNSRHKKNLFPLARPSVRATAPASDLSKESPLFLDPSAKQDDPELHIGFRKEYPYAINASKRGETTWRELGLDREDLAEMRRDHLQTVLALKSTRDNLANDKSDRDEAALLLEKFVKPEAPWSAMVRAALAL